MGPEASGSWPQTSGNLGRWTTEHPRAQRESHAREFSSCLGFPCGAGAGGKTRGHTQIQQVSLLASKRVLE